VEQCVNCRGGRNHIFWLRLRSCSKIFKCGFKIFLIWESDSCSDSSYRRCNRNSAMFHLRSDMDKDYADCCYCRNDKWLRIRIRFFTNFWLRLRVQKENAEFTGTPHPWPPLVNCRTKEAVSHYGKSMTSLFAVSFNSENGTKVAKLAKHFDIPATTLTIVSKNTDKKNSPFFVSEYTRNHVQHAAILIKERL